MQNNLLLFSGSNIIVMLKDKFIKYCTLVRTKWVIRIRQEDFEKKRKCEQGKVNS